MARFSVVAMVAAGAVALGCAAELENPDRFTGASSGSGGSGTGGSTGGGVAMGGTSPVAGGSGGSTAGSGGSGPAVFVPPDPPCWKALYTAQCKFCHDGAAGVAISGADLTSATGATLSKTVANYSQVKTDKTDCKAGALYIDPVTPANSYLLKKVSNTQGKCGTAMPSVNMPLTGDNLKCIQDWVNAF